MHGLSVIYKLSIEVLVALGYLLLGLWYTILMAIGQLRHYRRSFCHHQDYIIAKHIALSKAISMEDIKVVRKANPDTTLNDIIVACVERSFTAYLDLLDRNTEEGATRNHLRDSALNLIIPIGFRAPSDDRFENIASVDSLLLPYLPSDVPTAMVIQNARKHMMRLKLRKLALMLRGIGLLFTKLNLNYAPTSR